MMPFLRHRGSDRWWKLGLGLVYMPVIVGVITVEIWMNLDESVMWISLGVFWMAFLAFVFVTERRLT